MNGSSLIELLVALVIFSIATLGSGFLSLQSLKVTREGLWLTQDLTKDQTIDASVK